jgi:hypothetical protein
MHELHWLPQPEAHDYLAATSYLSLIMEPDLAAKVVHRLSQAEVVEFKAKDILRASRLPMLPADNHHVKSDLEKIEKKHALSPVLLVRGELTSGQDLALADGYHRVCAIEHLNEDLPIRCKIVGLKV